MARSLAPVIRAIALLLLAGAVTAEPAGVRAQAEIGAGIYLRGVIASGAPLIASRDRGAAGASGSAAACVNCHQHSGLGSMRRRSGTAAAAGSPLIPPVAARYLLEPERADGAHHGKVDLPYVEGMRTRRRAYTEETLARAIREGVDSEGRALDPLMPHFDLGPSDMAALIAYLKTLAPARIPGVSDSTIQFATIVTPDADPARRDAMLEVIEKYFAERNSRQMKPSPQLQASGHTQFSRSMFMIHRQWQLHVWSLDGPPATWGEQLAKAYAREPVMAVISGIGGAEWAPVHRFCEHEQLPCLFPNVEVPVDADSDFYDLYFSKGVLLEAELIAGRIVAQGARVVHQIYRAGDSGEAAARWLGGRLAPRHLELHDHALPAKARLEAALRGIGKNDALVLWLRPSDLAALAEEPAPPGAIYLSGLMGNFERAPLPAAWRERARMAYIVDLPQQRIVRVDYPLGWFRIRQIQIVDERLQADTYLACGLLSEALSDVAGTFDRAYLIEELQGMVEHRIVTGYYPRLTLAENQHFASKGGYLVQFAEPSGSRLVADGAWTVP